MLHQTWQTKMTVLPDKRIRDSGIQVAAIDTSGVDAVTCTVEMTDKDETDGILKGVVTFVDVRNGRDIWSYAVARELEFLGATVSQQFNRKVTHVIFDEGRQSTYNKAKKYGVHILSVLWIENCKQQGKRVPEDLYPAFIDESYINPLIKRKITRCVPQLSVEESLARRDILNKQNDRRRERKMLRQRLFGPDFSGDTKKLSPLKLNELIRPLPDLYGGLPIFDSTSEEEEEAANEDVPPSLARRLLQKFPDSPALLEGYERRNKNKLLLSEQKQKLNLTTEESPVRRQAITDPSFSKISDEYKRNDQVQQKTLQGNVLCDNNSYQTPVTIASNKRKILSPSPNSNTEIDEKMSELNIRTTKERPSIEEFKVKRKVRHKRRRWSSPEIMSTTSTSEMSVEENRQNVQTNAKVVVLTSFLFCEKEIVEEIIRKLGNAQVRHSVCSKTTHVVCSEACRTLNLLFGVVHGCWILSVNWVYDSLEADRWIDEEQYELTQHYPAAMVNRIKRQSSSTPFKCTLFSDVGPVFVGSGTKMEASNLRKLLLLSGTKVAQKPQEAAILVGQICGMTLENATNINELWVLDSIVHDTVFPLDTYSWQSDDKLINDKLDLSAL